jgi:hypothetical protein
MRGSVQMGESRISRMGTNGFSNGSVRGLLERGFFGNETDLFAADPKAGVGD